MRIYITHSTSFDFRNDLYLPLRQSKLNKSHEITLPHEKSDEQFDSKNYLKSCELVIAEVSFPSTGQGIELGWADNNKVPIICFYKKGAKPSGALHAVSNRFIEYENSMDMISKLEEILK